jgi:competence protein ComEA
MDEDAEQEGQDRLLKFIKSNFLIIALFVGGMLLLSIGMIQLVGTKTTKVKFEKAASVDGVSVSASVTPRAQIKVDIEGEVIRPGLYSLNSDARIQDALAVAGGLTQGADRDQINLAARVVDGQKVYIPAVGETPPVSPVVSSSSDSVTSANVTSSGPVSINSGSESELDSLPGVGPVTAQKIISNRPYSSIDELVSKKAVGQKEFDKIKEMISL